MSVAAVMTPNAIIWTVFSEINGLPAYHKLPARSRSGASHQDKVVRRHKNQYENEELSDPDERFPGP